MAATSLALGAAVGKVIQRLRRRSLPDGYRVTFTIRPPDGDERVPVNVTISDADRKSEAEILREIGSAMRRVTIPATAESAIALPPVIRDADWKAAPFLLLRDGHPSVGWQERTADKGGRCYLIGRAGGTGRARVLARYPHTSTGWIDTWRRLLDLDPERDSAMRAVLAARRADNRARAGLDA